MTALFLYVLVRGHRENEDSTNKGNFLESLELRSIDNELIRRKKDELQYTHYDIQNEIIDLIQQQIINQIKLQINESKYYSVMIDETCDVSKKEQVSLVVRYCDKQFNVYEKFLGFERTGEMSGEALFELLVQWLNKLDFKMKYLVGQCYDGASSMRGEYKGVAARLKQIAPLGKKEIKRKTRYCALPSVC